MRVSERLLISIPEAAELVGLSRSYVWREVKRGELVHGKERGMDYANG